MNKKFLQIALLEPTPNRINMPASFLEDFARHFEWFTEAESTTGFHSWLTTNGILKDFMYKTVLLSWSSFLIYILKNIISR